MGATSCISDVYITLFLFIGALCSCAFFAFLETSVATLKLFTIEELERSVRRYPTLFTALRFHQHRVLTTMVIANSSATVIATTFSTRLLLHCFQNIPHYFELPLSLLFTTTIMLLCGEVIPKHLAQTLGSHLIRYTLWGTNATYHTLYPLVTILTALSEKVVHYVARSYQIRESNSDYVSQEEILFLINCMHRAGTMSSIQHTLLNRVFALTTLPAKAIMIPITHHSIVPESAIIIAAEETAERAAALLAEHNATELMVRDTHGTIIGIISSTALMNAVWQPTRGYSLDNRLSPQVSLQRTAIDPSLHEDTL